MGLFNKFPYTDFHELNLSFIFDDLEKLANRIKDIVIGLKLENSNDNKLVLKDENDNPISSVTVAYSSRSGHSDTSDTSGSAETATRASKAVTDVNEKNITSYVASGEMTNNILVLKDSIGHTVSTLPLTPTSVIAKLEGYYKSGEKTVFDSDLANGDEIIVLTDCESLTEITSFLDSMIEGNIGSICIYDSTKTYPNVFSSCYALKRTGNPPIPLVTMTAIYGEETSEGWSNIKWRLFHITYLSGQVDGKYAFKLTRVD